MRFALHKYRQEDNLDDKQYRRAQAVYFKHLEKLDFAGNSEVLKYFGYDFFHSAVLHSINMDVAGRSVGISLIREEADLEDINKFRKGCELPDVTVEQYREAPIIYRWRFDEIDHLRASLDYCKGIRDVSVLDAELDRARAKGRLSLAVSLDSGQELSFTFSKASQAVVSKERVQAYTGGKLTDVPYCEHCCSLLLDPKCPRPSVA